MSHSSGPVNRVRATLGEAYMIKLSLCDEDQHILHGILDRQLLVHARALKQIKSLSAAEGSEDGVDTAAKILGAGGEVRIYFVHREIRPYELMDAD